jgi:hypothetical protein
MDLPKTFKNKLYVCHFKGHYLEGNAIVVSTTKRKALNALNKDLVKRGLAEVEFDDLREITLELSVPLVKVLFDGDY